MPSRETSRWQHFAEQRAERAVRMEIKRNRKPKRSRRRQWDSKALDDLDGLEEAEGAQDERIMPRGEQERRRALWTLALERLEADALAPGFAPQEGGLGRQTGVVVEVSTAMCRVDVDGRIHVCGLRGSLSAAESGFHNVVAVGDEVLVSLDGQDSGIVEQVLPRRSALVRPDVFHSHLQQVIVANAEQLLVVGAWREPALWPELVDRCLIAGQRYGLTPLLCLNKVDLADDGRACSEAVAPYQRVGYRVVLASALTGEGIAELRDVLRGHTTALTGLSGVGKSSLLAAVQPGLQLRTAEVSSRRHEGRHTTTQVRLLRLEMGGFVVDTPGIREFGLSGLRRSELAGFYPEMASLGQDCRFANCTHTHEPGCAVRDAVGRGGLSPVRYDSYTKILASLPND